MPEEAIQEVALIKKRIYSRIVTPSRAASVRKYNEVHHDRHVKANREWRNRNKGKRRAHNAVARAVRAGKLTKLPCSVCGNGKSQAHHEDYTKLLEVKWLCQKHHKELHRLYP